MKYIQGDPSLYPIDWSQERILAFRQTLMNWYDATKRELPWRGSRNPYKIWVSEIMAQQTQLVTVIPYYERFIEELPTIQSLAEAPEETILTLWQGLGYYSRARNMQTAAQQVMSEYGGQMPDTMKGLMSLKGIGPYTAAAIGSIVYDLVEPAIDGNLMRVIARMFELEADISQPKSRKIFAAILYQLIDPTRPGDFNQALMDLGATIMTPANLTPELNPIKDFDLSYANQSAHLYPVKKKKTKVSKHQLIAYVIENEKGEWLMRKHGETELLTGLWHFPIIEQSMVMESVTESELIEPFDDWYQKQLEQLEITLPDDLTSERQFVLHEDYWTYSPQPALQRELKEVKHIFSHRVWHVQVLPVKWKPSQHQLYVNLAVKNDVFQWIAPQKIQQIPLSTLQQKLIHAVKGDS